MIVLDEPNSNLDTEGERALTEAFEQVRKRGGIVVVVAHRSSALSAVNKVLMIQNGHQAAFGDRGQILKDFAVLNGAGERREANIHAV